MPSTTAAAAQPHTRLAKQLEPTNQDEDETEKAEPQRLIAPPPAYGNRVVEVQPKAHTADPTPAG